MKSTLPFLLFFLPLFLLAQETIQSTHRLAFVASPDISYFAGHHASTLGKQSPRLGYRFRVDGELQLSNRFWLRLGVGFAHMRYKQRINSSSLQWPSQNNNGQFDPSKPGESAPEYLLREDKMIVVPTALRYFWNTQFYSDLELGANFIFAQGSDKLLTRPGFGCAVGWQKALGPRSYFFVQPAFRFILNKAFEGALSDYNQHPYSIGIETGVRGFLK